MRFTIGTRHQVEGPNGRKWHTCTQVKNKLIVLGGEAINKQFMRDVLVLDLGEAPLHCCLSPSPHTHSVSLPFPL